MAVFHANNLVAARLDRENRRLREERDAFERLAIENSRAAWNLQQELTAAKSVKQAPPANLEEVTKFLKMYVPTLPLAPGYNTLVAANDAQSYAQALNLMLQHARLVGRQEGQPR